MLSIKTILILIKRAVFNSDVCCTAKELNWRFSTRFNNNEIMLRWGVYMPSVKLNMWCTHIETAHKKKWREARM